jgi:hypothetical protein
MRKKILFLGLMFALAGCANFSSKEQLSKLALKRAAYDLSCKEDEIKITELQDKRYGGLYDDFSEEVMYGAEGCGQKQTYQVTNPEYSQPMVYKEGAAPNPVVIQGGGSIKPYKAPDMSWHPIKSHY